MKYYKANSIPLEEVELGIGETGFDQYGNYIEVNMFNEPHILRKTVMKDGETIDKYENILFLKAFWAMTNKNLEHEIQDAIEE